MLKLREKKYKTTNFSWFFVLTHPKNIFWSYNHPFSMVFKRLNISTPQSSFWTLSFHGTSPSPNQSFEGQHRYLQTASGQRSCELWATQCFMYVCILVYTYYIILSIRLDMAWWLIDVLLPPQVIVQSRHRNMESFTLHSHKISYVHPPTYKSSGDRQCQLGFTNKKNTKSTNHYTGLPQNPKYRKWAEHRKS